MKEVTQGVLEDVAANIAAKKSVAIKLVRKENTHPWSMFINKDKNVLYLHNITDGVVRLLGYQIESIILKSIEAWENDGLGKVNITNSVFDYVFGSVIDKSGIELDSQERNRLLRSAKVHTKGGDEKMTMAVLGALKMFNVDVLDDKELVEFFFNSPESFANPALKFRHFNNLVKINLSEEESLPLKSILPKYDKTGDLRARIEESLDVDENTLMVLGKIIKDVGSPNFIRAYSEYIKKEKELLKTPASSEDLAGLLDGFTL